MPSFDRHFGARSQPSELVIEELIQDIEEPLNDPRLIDDPTLTAVDFDEIEIMV